MLFNSIQFAVFLPVVFIVYWLIGKKSRVSQNIFLLAASYVFYGFWDYRFLFLILASSLVDYSVAIKIDSTSSKRVKKWMLALSLVFNLGLLGVFKYYNFFASEFQSLFQSWGVDLNITSLNLILPVGISFYTFQTLSYSIDVFKGKMKADKNILNVFLYVAFFPQLVAGPIEKASALLPQMQKNRIFSYSYAVDGLRQILWGLFKKVVIADSCAILVNQVYAAPELFGSYEVIIATLFFSFQIYGDFSGYSDIAIGTAKLFGFQLRDNFLFPYFSRDIAEFWRRWHISLSSWFKEYIYFPLGGSRGGLFKSIRNVMVIFILSGFWHGANWTFIIWGTANAMLFVPLMVFNINRKNIDIVHEKQFLKRSVNVLKIVLNFVIVNFLWIVFRSPNIATVKTVLSKMFSVEPFAIRHDFQILTATTFAFIFIMLFMEWKNRDKTFGLDFSHMKNTVITRMVRWGVYILLIFSIILSFPNEATSFIYFQF